MSLLSPLRPIPRYGNPFLKFLGNAFNGELILQRPTPYHLWATARLQNSEASECVAHSPRQVVGGGGVVSLKETGYGTITERSEEE